LISGNGFVHINKVTLQCTITSERKFYTNLEEEWSTSSVVRNKNFKADGENSRSQGQAVALHMCVCDEESNNRKFKLGVQVVCRLFPARITQDAISESEAICHQFS